jgi:hypothetical protein
MVDEKLPNQTFPALAIQGCLPGNATPDCPLSAIGRKNKPRGPYREKPWLRLD